MLGTNHQFAKVDLRLIYQISHYQDDTPDCQDPGICMEYTAWIPSHNTNNQPDPDLDYLSNIFSTAWDWYGIAEPSVMTC